MTDEILPSDLPQPSDDWVGSLLRQSTQAEMGNQSFNVVQPVMQRFIEEQSTGRLSAVLAEHHADLTGQCPDYWPSIQFALRRDRQQRRMVVGSIAACLLALIISRPLWSIYLSIEKPVDTAAILTSQSPFVIPVLPTPALRQSSLKEGCIDSSGRLPSSDQEAMKDRMGMITVHNASRPAFEKAASPVPHRHFSSMYRRVTHAFVRPSAETVGTKAIVLTTEQKILAVASQQLKQHVGDTKAGSAGARVALIPPSDEYVFNVAARTDARMIHDLGH